VRFRGKLLNYNHIFLKNASVLGKILSTNLNKLNERDLYPRDGPFGGENKHPLTTAAAKSQNTESSLT
jgi:hypothetical protein